MIAPPTPSIGYLIYKDDADGKLYALYQDGTKTQLAPASASGGGLQPLTAPISGNFSQKNFNVGSGVTSFQFNNVTGSTSITLSQNDPSNTGNFIAIDKAVIASKSFTLSVGFVLAVGGSAASNGAGLWLSDGGGTPNSLMYGWQGNTNTAQGLFADTFSSFLVSSAGAGIMHTNACFSPGPLTWVRIVEDASHRTYFVSSDGINWGQVFQETVTNHFTTTRYGFMLFPNGVSSGSPNAMATMYSFSETTP